MRFLFLVGVELLSFRKLPVGVLSFWCESFWGPRESVASRGGARYPAGGEDSSIGEFVVRILMDRLPAKTLASAGRSCIWGWGPVSLDDGGDCV
ncbi:hypothetical protein MTP99_007345 [Tenebrio molitor]|jgi:hypothetical protein|nr:hypothetical protein MTP99_007345 [Tenebrio molitor]